MCIENTICKKKKGTKITSKLQVLNLVYISMIFINYKGAELVRMITHNPMLLYVGVFFSLAKAERFLSFFHDEEYQCQSIKIAKTKI